MVRATKPPQANQQLSLSMYPKQEAFVRCQCRVRALTGGRGSGKSKIGAIDLMLRSQPNSLYMVVGPSYKSMERATMRTFIEVAEQLGIWPGEEGYYKQERRVAGLNGAEYLFCSADDAQSLRGPNASGAWMDEMQDTDEEAYVNTKLCLRQHGKQGWITGTFTPADPSHWTSQAFITCCNVPSTAQIYTASGTVDVPYSLNPDGDTAFFRASLKENVFIDPEFYANACKDLAASPLRLRREIEGECVYLSGAEWLPEYFDGIEFSEWPKESPGDLRVVALDPSRGSGDKKGDYSAFVLLWFHGGKLYIDADMRNDRGDIEIAHAGVQIYRDFNPHYFVVESESGQNDHLIRDMHGIADDQKMPMAITRVDSRLFGLHGKLKLDKISRIRTLGAYVSGRWFRFKSHSPGAKILRDQMMSFPLGHDDGPDALAHGVNCLVKVTTGQVLPPNVYGTSPMGKILEPGYYQQGG